MAKKCNKCLEWKEAIDFQADKRNSDGLQGDCSKCKNAYKQAARLARESSNAYTVVKEKSCNDCGATKPAEEFYKDKAMPDGRAAICKMCKTKKVYAWREANKEKYNKTQRDFQKRIPAEQRYGSEIKRRYGCTLEQYNAMLTAQGGACAICKCLHNPAEKKGRLYVDHCHDSGKVRALLCKHCNSMIGYAKDDTRVLLEAVAYLTRHKKPNP